MIVFVYIFTHDVVFSIVGYSSSIENFEIIYTGQKKLRIICLNCFQKKYEYNFDHLFSPYFLPYVDNTVMLPVGP
jgi:hypothetical protein